MRDNLEYEAERWKQDRLALAREQQHAKFWPALAVIGPIVLAALLVWYAA